MACFERKTKSFQEPGDFSGKWETREFSGKYDIVRGHGRKKAGH